MYVLQRRTYPSHQGPQWPELYLLIASITDLLPDLDPAAETPYVSQVQICTIPRTDRPGRRNHMTVTSCINFRTPKWNRNPPHTLKRNVDKKIMSHVTAYDTPYELPLLRQ